VNRSHRLIVSPDPVVVMASSSTTISAEALPAFPPLAALFLTYFDDLKGQTVSYYSSLSGE